MLLGLVRERMLWRWEGLESASDQCLRLIRPRWWAAIGMLSDTNQGDRHRDPATERRSPSSNNVVECVLANVRAVKSFRETECLPTRVKHSASKATDPESEKR